MFVFILRVKSAEVNEQDSDSENEDHEGDMSLPFTKKACPPPSKKFWTLVSRKCDLQRFLGLSVTFFRVNLSGI